MNLHTDIMENTATEVSGDSWLKNVQINFSPSLAEIAELQDRYPANPFVTTAYAASRESCGHQVAVIEFGSGPSEPHSCLAFVRRTRFGGFLDIPTLTDNITVDHLDALYRAVRSRRLSHVSLDAYGSPTLLLPRSEHETERIERTELYFDLTLPVTIENAARTHRQRIRQAQKQGLTLKLSKDEAAYNSHNALVAASMRRRSDRGENVQAAADNPELRAMAACDAGIFAQAVAGTEVLSSMFVVRSRLTGYDQTSGSRPDGMKIGAAHFLIYSVAVWLQAQGATEFNLGGVRPEEIGLRAFKEGFGIETRSMQSVILGAESAFVRAARSLYHRTRDFVRS